MQGGPAAEPAPRSESSPGRAASRLNRLAWLPIPVLLAAIVALWVADLRTEYPSPHLAMWLNFIARTLASLLVVYLVGRSFLARRAPGLLLLGCGVAIWGTAGFVSTAMLTRDANLSVTISNLAAWLAALCHLAGASLSVRSRQTIRAPRLWLGAGYALALGVVGLITLASFSGVVPVFFVQGQGGTLVRHVVLGSAIAMLATATLLVRMASRQSSLSFGHWYALALLLIAVGLFGVMIESSRDTALDWTCRAAQYLSGVYMFIAALLVRDPSALTIRLEQALGAPRYRHGVAIAFVLAATAVRLVSLPRLGTHSPFLTFYPAVMLAALYGGLLPGLLATALSAILTTCLWMEPVGRFSIGQPEDWLSLAVFLPSCTMICFVIEAMHRARAKAAAAQAEVALATERMRASEALRESDALLRAVIETIPDPIYIKDAKSRLTLVNPAALALVAKPADQVIGHTDREIYDDPAMGDAILDNDRQVMQSGVVHVFEETIETPHGNRVMLDTKAPRRDAAGRVVGLVGLARDITERKRDEEALRRERDFSAAVIDTAGALVVVLDRDGRIQRFNRACERVTGYSAADVTGRTVWDLGLIAPEELPGVRHAWDALLRGELPHAYENLWIAKDGSRRLIAWSNTAIMDRAGTVESIIGTGVEITERKKLEQDLRAANLRLAEDDRRKNEFLAVLSHELRNPLAPIRNSLYILEHAAPGGDRARRAQAVIDRQASQLARLVDDLLDVTRITRNKIEIQHQRLDLNEVVRSTLEDQRSQFEDGEVELRLSAAADRVFVNGDWNRLSQAVGNLLQNAGKFTGRGGSVTVSVSAESPSGQAVIRVADTGLGIAPDVLPRLFQPFMQADSTLDRSKGGLGLGLALVKGLVELHGGTVSARSDGLGKGAEFVVRLPLDRSRPPDAVAPSTSREPSPRRVLIIEDNVDAAVSLREALELGGHVVEVAHGGPDGLAKARGFHPEVVLCDIGLPGMDGYEVGRRFRADKATKGAFLVALTGYVLPEDLQRAQKAGFELQLAKPPDMEQLQEILATLPPGAHR